MSVEILRRAASLMRERAEAATSGPWFANLGGYVEDRPFLSEDGEGHLVADTWNRSSNSAHIASWHPTVALAVARAMEDVAHAWEIADESADGWVYDADDNHYTFAETVDGGWLQVARAYLGES